MTFYTPLQQNVQKNFLFTLHIFINRKNEKDDAAISKKFVFRAQIEIGIDSDRAENYFVL